MMRIGSKEVELSYFGDNANVRDFIERFLVGIENWDESLAMAIVRLHNGIHRQTINLKESMTMQIEPLADTGIPPRILFVTMTSAVPYAYAIRECWGKAWPEEKLPKFFTLDVSRDRLRADDWIGERLLEVINRRQIGRLRCIGQKFHAFDEAAVFDEFYNTGRTLREAQVQFQRAGFRGVNFMVGHWGANLRNSFIPRGSRPFGRKGRGITEAMQHGYPIVQINRDSISLVRDMQTIGREMAQQILGYNQ